MSEPPNWKLVTRYLANTATPDERARVDAWAARDPDHRAQLDALRALSDATDHLPARLDTERSLAEVHRRFGIPSPRPAIRLVPPSAGRGGPWRYVGLAAALCLAVLGSLTLWRSGWFANGRPFREFVSARGSRMTITLRDGTTLVLGPATRLRVPRDFGRSARTIDLDGEALLTVVHDERRPLAVRTAHAIVRDVGTTFAVRAYGDDPQARVAVLEGRVAIGAESLGARDVATITTSGGVTVRRRADIGPLVDWTQGRLAFEDTPLREVARELSRTFDLDIQIADSTIAARHITATFSAESADDVLEAVAYLVHGQLERTGRAVVIRRANVPARQAAPSRETLQRMTQSEARQ